MAVTDLEQLEEKIARAIFIIKKLQAENQQLKKANDALRSQIQAQEQTIEWLKRQPHSDGDASDQIKGYREREEKIKVKIKQMLEKLEMLQSA
ncbi:MAG: cell division protein ZapB [candidate division KSB1 bacterium]|nr:cell division protein ZapB [candidate division KSB1 bacterium]MDZ7341114.1 cell division protein ZapB [candidate division KSB1 bacterium]